MLPPWPGSPSPGTRLTMTSMAMCQRSQLLLAPPKRCWDPSTMWCSSTTMARYQISLRNILSHYSFCSDQHHCEWAEDAVYSSVHSWVKEPLPKHFEVRPTLLLLSDNLYICAGMLKSLRLCRPLSLTSTGRSRCVCSGDSDHFSYWFSSSSPDLN